MPWLAGGARPARVDADDGAAGRKLAQAVDELAGGTVTAAGQPRENDVEPDRTQQFQRRLFLGNRDGGMPHVRQQTTDGRGIFRRPMNDENGFSLSWHTAWVMPVPDKSSPDGGFIFVCCLQAGFVPTQAHASRQPQRPLARFMQKRQSFSP
jgi:hypothetical protein